MATEQKIEKNEQALDEILFKIVTLASKINADEIRRETAGSRLDSEQLNAKVQQIASNLPDASLNLNKTRNLYDDEKAKSDDVSESLKNFVTKNDIIQDEIKTVILF